jgi:hypothetical protein
MKSFLILTAIVYLALGACAPYKSFIRQPALEAYDLNPAAGSYPKVPADQIIVYASKKFAPKQYVVLAKLKSTAGGDWLKEEELYKELRRKASELGADAVIVDEVTPITGGGIQLNTDNPPNRHQAWIAYPPDIPVTVYVPAPTKEPTAEEQKLLKCYAIAVRVKP